MYVLKKINLKTVFVINHILICIGYFCKSINIFTHLFFFYEISKEEFVGFFAYLLQYVSKIFFFSNLSTSPVSLNYDTQHYYGFYPKKLRIYVIHTLPI